MNLLQAIGAFASQFWRLMPTLAPRFALAWGLTLLVLLVGFTVFKPRLRGHLLRLDTRVRNWAAQLRFRDIADHTTDRVLRTWFFRFWTNFASAPTLIVLSLALAIWGTATDQKYATLFYLPGFCYAGSSFLSYFTKRVFKRPRPQRAEGSFGHKMKDASFPSGHSLTSFCFWFGCLLAAPLIGMGMMGFGALSLLAITTVVCTGLSRVYLGVHFPSDVLGGYFIGLVWCVVCYFALVPALR